jgi:hypothetical protein
MILEALVLPVCEEARPVNFCSKTLTQDRIARFTSMLFRLPEAIIEAIGRKS